MENIEHLIIYFKDFENKIKELLQTGEEVLKHKIKSISDINELEKLIDEWINNCDEFFKKSFNKEDNEFRKIFKQPIYQYKKPSINRNAFHFYSLFFSSKAFSEAFIIDDNHNDLHVVFIVVCNGNGCTYLG